MYRTINDSLDRCKIVAATAFILFVACLNTNAQLLQPYRYEREQKNSDDYFHVISLKEKGLALFR